MLTWEDDLEVHALRKRGWSISAMTASRGVVDFGSGVVHAL